jgi:hypothetical protein
MQKEFPQEPEVFADIIFFAPLKRKKTAFSALRQCPAAAQWVFPDHYEVISFCSSC